MDTTTPEVEQHNDALATYAGEMARIITNARTLLEQAGANMDTGSLGYRALTSALDAAVQATMTAYTATMTTSLNEAARRATTPSEDQ